MSQLHPTFVIACGYSPMRRALIELLQRDFPDVHLRLVHDLAHMTLGLGTGFEGVFVDSCALDDRVHAVHDVCGPLKMFVCDTPGWYAPDAPRLSHASSNTIYSALPTLLSLFPLARPDALLALERLLVGVASAPSSRGQGVSTDTPCPREKGAKQHDRGFMLSAI